MSKSWLIPGSAAAKACPAIFCNCPIFCREGHTGKKPLSRPAGCEAVFDGMDNITPRP